ncbi:MAG: hypothetical protein JO333_03990 [Verrucomicrobia bacterium]|nr:hypothetical protein [Verrucomicrobiota bacterium]
MNLQAIRRGLTRLLFLTVASLGAGAADAQNLATSPTLSAGGISQSGTLSTFSYEFSADAAFIGRGSVDLGDKTAGVFTEISSSATLVLSDQISNSFILRLGIDWERFAFNTSNRLTPLPASVNALDAVIGGDIQLTSALLVRIEAHPGIYGSFNEVTGRDFNVPIRIGASYFQSTNLIYIAGLSIDVNSDWPVIPAIGVYWKVSDHWVINGVAPRPQLQYIISDKLTLFAGPDLQTATFRVDNEFGTSRGIPKLNHAILDFWEIRGGAGFTWALTKGIKLDLEGGVVPYRQFDFNRADFNMSSTSWSPYIRLGISASF